MLSWETENDGMFNVIKLILIGFCLCLVCSNGINRVPTVYVKLLYFSSYIFLYISTGSKLFIVFFFDF